MRRIITILILSLGLSGVVFATHVSHNISTTNSERYAWNDVIGWIDFGNGEVEVMDTKLTGYANSSQVGRIALDCATSPNGNVCGGPAGNWGIANDGNGNLSGWAWNENIGWISFSGANFRVVIDSATGDFNGWAWNDAVGWISFNCGNAGADGCSRSSYKVKTSFYPAGGGSLPGAGGGFTGSVSLTSSIFDTQVAQGAAINTIMWQGSLGGGLVGFQIASSNNSNGPWTFVGPDGSNSSYYQPLPGVQTEVKLTGQNNHNNKRYVRYKVFLDAPTSPGPQINDVIIGYSP